VIKLRGSASLAAGVLIMLSGLGIPAAMTTTQAAAATAPAQGADVSNHTPVTSSTWSDLAQAGATFVGVAATEGNYFQDPDYASDVTGATDAGLYAMPYVFANPYHTNGTAAGQADYAVAWMSKVTPPSALTLPLALDLEPDPYVSTEQNSNECYGLTTSAMVTWIKGFLAEAQAKTGRTPVIYTEAAWWNTCTGNSTAFSSYPLWLASWGVPNPALPSGWGNYTFWQYTNAGTISGISGGTDLDYLGPVLQTSAAGAAITPVRLQTLTSLNDPQAASYTVPAAGSAGALPPGLSLSSSGQITGTPTKVGAYAVTVAPEAGAVPSSLDFTWNVHAPITVAGASRTGTAGTPVSLQVTSTGQDQSAGFKPTFTATGLPPGLTMNSAGLITGWPYAPGSYTVKVTASDALGGSGTTSFSWKISAAGDSGTTGTIKQVGGSAKCLNDPDGSTANGAKPNMWTCDGKTYQNWTVVQDGTIRAEGKCLQMAGNGSAANTALELETCNSGNAGQQWQAGSYGELVNPASGKCAYLGSTSEANGYLPVAHACANDARHQFLRPAAPVVSGQPGKCLAVAGSVAEMVSCASTASQHWVAEPSGTFAASGKCLAETGTAAGAKASAAGCAGTPPTWEKWTVVSAGRVAVELKNVASGKCVTVPSGATASGTGLLMEGCANNPAGTWRIG
jgi:GH25 family lysozyme M1 (1,4-beta-N-acetylmuramidase)